MHNNELIFKLFQVDKVIYQKHSKLKQLLNDEQCDQLKNQVKSLEEHINFLESQLASKKKEIKKEELESEKFHQEKQQLESDIYSGKISDSKELNDMSDKIESLSVKEQKAFDKYYQLSEELEIDQENLSIEQEKLSKLKQELNSKEQSKLETQKKLEQELENHINTRKKLKKEVSESLLEKYSNLFKRFPFDAVVELSKDHDGCACGLNISTQKHNQLQVQGIEECDNCARIIVCFD